MNKHKFSIAFTVVFAALLGVQNLFAQNSAGDETLSPNKEIKFVLKPKQGKDVYLNLKKGEFAEIFWKDSLQRFPDFSLVSPSGRQLLEEIYVTDSIPLVAPEDGKYQLTVKFDDSDEEKKDDEVAVSLSNNFKLPKSAKLARQRKLGGYDIKVYNTGEQESATFLVIEKGGKLQEILKGGSLVGGGFNFADEPALFDYPAGKKSAALFRATADKTGDGTPDIAVQFFSGGAHCCTDLHFYELGKDGLRKLPTIEGRDSDVLAIGKKPNGSLILKTGDSTFAYWQVCFACSPIPSVILSFKNGEFRPDLQLMKKPAPSLAVLKQKAIKASKTMDLKPYTGVGEIGSSGFEEAFWGEMLDLMYSGNETAAWQYFDLVWDKRKPGKEIFKQDFLRQLNESRYWQMMQEDRYK